MCARQIFRRCYVVAGRLVPRGWYAASSTIGMMQLHMHVIKGPKSRCGCVVGQGARRVTSLFVDSALG